MCVDNITLLHVYILTFVLFNNLSMKEIFNDILRVKSKSHEAEEEATPIILSLLDPTYKQVMFAAFQKLGAKHASDRDPNEENRVKGETYNLLKSTGRKFMKYRNYRSRKEGFVEIDEKAARESK